LAQIRAVIFEKNEKKTPTQRTPYRKNEPKRLQVQW